MGRSRLVMVIAAAMAASQFGTAPPAQAQNYPWCAEYGEDMGGSRNCGFVSFQQCMTNVQGLGGFCAENNTYVPPPGPHHGPAQQVRKRHNAKNS